MKINWSGVTCLGKACFFLLLLVVQRVYMKETVLVTGGAGYIGSHTAHLLAEKGFDVLVLDNFLYKQPFNPSWATVIKGDIGDVALLNKIFSQYNISAVIHFAGFIAVGESVRDPLKYYENNIGKTLTLLRVMRERDVQKFIFSSSAAVYGIPKRVPIVEDDIKNPINPYGQTKWSVEQILYDCAHAYGLKFAALRYFNACGAQPEDGLVERHEPETHIIPLAIRAALNKTSFNMFGDDYDTKDGTCIRDYLHVTDLAEAHVCSLGYLNNDGKSGSFNPGTGQGYSVKEVLDMVSRVCDVSLHIKTCARREGDPARLIANPSKAHSVLNWRAQHSDLYKIVSDAYRAECLMKTEHSQCHPKITSATG